MRCWAESLGGCGGGDSREHIIAKSQFDGDVITVEGLPWCKEARTVGLNSLVSKVLCRNHNSELSAADSEALRHKEALGELLRGKSRVTVSIDARLVEQWLLKTTINLALQEPGSGLLVTEALVRRAFGREPTPTGEGFFAVVEEQERIEGTSAIRFETRVRKTDKRLVLGIFVLHGYRMLYAFEGSPPVRGALRPRRWQRHDSTIDLVWHPDFAASDGGMAPLQSSL